MSYLLKVKTESFQFSVKESSCNFVMAKKKKVENKARKFGGTGTSLQTGP